jgi:hypothetical protein
MCKPLKFSIYLFVALLVYRPCLAENPIFNELLSRGVAIGPREVMQLPAPTLADGMSASQQRQVIEAIPDNSRSWEDLTHRSVVAPYILKISKGDNSQQRLGRRVDLWFVAYGNLATLGNKEFLQSQFKSVRTETSPENAFMIKVLSESDLTSRGLMPPHCPEDPRYFAAELSLLGRVRISATTTGAKSETQDSILAASMLETRFANDPQFPNRWRPILRDESGRRYLGPPEPYFGYGGYAKAARLVEPAGAIFIEYHVVFAEPAGWFGSSNSLRSKIPILAQYIVRQLRSGLEKSK